MAPQVPLWVWGLKTRPKSWPNWWTFWVTCYLEIMFPTFQTLDLLKPYLETNINKIIRSRFNSTNLINSMTRSTDHSSPLDASESIGNFEVTDFNQLTVFFLWGQLHVTFVRYPTVRLRCFYTHPVLVVLECVCIYKMKTTVCLMF